MMCFLRYRFAVCAAAVSVLIATSAVAQSVTIRGIVTDSSREPLPEASVVLVPDKTRYFFPDEIEPIARATSNQNGEFALTVSSTTQPVALMGWTARHRMTKFPVNLESAEGRMVGLALQDGFTLNGKVIDQETGTPVSGASVGPLAPGLDVPMQRGLRIMPQWTTTDDQGRFTLSGIATDIDHQFIVQAEGYTLANVELSPRQRDVTVPLSKGGFTISGEVYATDRRDSVFSDTLIWANGNGFNLYTKTNSQSRFTINGLPGGTFSVEPLFPQAERATEVSVIEMPRDSNTSISLKVSGGYYIEGTTIDDETSSTAANVPVSIGERWTTSSASGRFRLGPFYTATYISPIVPEKDGWKLVEVKTGNEYDTAEGFEDMRDIEIRVRRRRDIQISLDGYEYTTSPVMMTLMASTGEVTRAEATSRSLSMPVFSRGNYFLYGTSGGLATELQTVTVGDSTSIPVALTLDQAARVFGQVVVTNSNETTRVQTLRLSTHINDRGENGPAVSFQTNPKADGGFSMPVMPTGQFLLTISNQTGTHKTTRSVTFSRGANDLGTLTFEAGNRLTGRVISGPDSVVPFARVTLALEEGLMRTETDENGKFAFEDIYTEKLPTLVVEAATFALHRQADLELPAENLEIVLQRMGRIVITVDASAGSQWDVHLVRMNRWAMGTYADQMIGNSIFQRQVLGGESLETSLDEEGVFRAVAVARGGAEVRVSEAFQWAGQKATGETIVLDRGTPGRISGTVEGASGSVQVTVINTAVPEQAGRDSLEKIVPVNNGRFDVSGLVPGNYMVLGEGELYSGHTLNVEVGPGETAIANLSALQALTAQGQVIFADQPLVGAKVSIISETDPSSSPRTVETDAEGRFAFDGILPDSYQITATYDSDEGQLQTQTAITVEANKPLPAVMLNLTPPSPVLFTVEPGFTLNPEMPVMLMNKQTRQLTTAKWVNGQIEADVPPGEYEVWEGDSVNGKAIVSEDATGRISRQ